MRIGEPTPAEVARENNSTLIHTWFSDVDRALKPQATTSSSQSEQNQNGLTYLDSGVSIDSGNELVTRIKPLVKATARLGCDSVIGGFGGLFDLKSVGYRDPVIVSGTDGVGTKLIVAQKAGKHDTVGLFMFLFNLIFLFSCSLPPRPCSRLLTSWLLDTFQSQGSIWLP